MTRRRSAQAVGALLGSDPPSGARGFDPQGELIKLALKGAEGPSSPTPPRWVSVRSTCTCAR
jgi:hypothetical protein